MSDGTWQDLDKRIERATDSARRARIHLDLFDFLMKQDNLDEHERAIAPYWDFFRFSGVAHEWAFCIRICNLLTKSTQTNNFISLTADMVKGGIITDREVEEINGIIEPHRRTYESVKAIRDKAVAHQDEKYPQLEVYKSASLTLPAMIDLSDASLRVGNFLCAVRNLPTCDFYETPLQALQQMLYDLRALPEGMEAFFKRDLRRKR